MKTFVKILCLSFVSFVLLAGCGGGGSSDSAAPGPTTNALTAGGAGVTMEQVVDSTGTAVTASFTSAIDINDLGQVIGIAEVAEGSAFVASLWSVDTDGSAGVAPAALSPISGNTFSAAFAIDESGNAVGQSARGTQLVAVLWPGGGDPVELPSLAPGGNSAAFAVSADGTLVAGEAQDAAGRTRAVLWIADAQGAFALPVQLPVSLFAKGTDLSPFSSASGVARAGAAEILVVGEVEAGGGKLHAALWRSENGGDFSVVDLGVDHAAYAVNSSRQIVGETDDTLAPVSWRVSEQGIISGPLALAEAGSAVAVNETGRIAGWSGIPGQASVWSGDTSLALFDTASQAYGLNNDLQPLVVGRNGNQGFVKRVE